MIDYPRPEAVSAVIFGGGVIYDDLSVETRLGRMIPGPAYAARELKALMDLAEVGTLLPVPSTQQLGRISLNSDMGCWELPVYDDKKSRARYGQMNVAGLPNPSGNAHRTMYQVFYGADSLPNGPLDFLDHLCENKACCYPRHLEVVTPGLNTLRARLSSVVGQLSLEYPQD